MRASGSEASSAMRAIRITAFGGPEVLRLAEVPRPEPAADEILIKVGAAGVNFAETLMREDRYVSSYTLPAIPGSEVAGTIQAVGRDVVGFSPGQRVAAMLAASGQLTGGYAEYTVAKANTVRVLPDSMAFDMAAALLVQGFTAINLMSEVNPGGKHVLVTAAAGGVGSLLLMLAKQKGAAKVTAAASTSEKCAFALVNGADEAVEYKDIATLSPGLIYDSVGGDVMKACLDALAFKGVLVSYGSLSINAFPLGVAQMKRLILDNQSIRGFSIGALLTPKKLSNDLDELFNLYDAGVVRPHVRSFPIAEANRAHESFLDRNTVGKIVLVP